MSRTLVELVLEEASDIWRDAGVRVVWKVARDVARDEPAPDVVRLIIDDDAGPKQGVGWAIGWVIFQGNEPRPEIHLSYANAVVGLERSCRVGALSRMWKAQIDELVAVALGRALAHELGHYLLGAAHSGNGLMHGDWSPTEMFGADRPHVRLDAAQRAALTSKLLSAPIGTNR